MATISENLQTIINSELAMKQAIIDKGGIINGDITTWADSIINIPSGSEKPIIYEKDVNFYDYDGTVLYAYTKDEFLALNDLPPLPTQPGLTCQEWNWDYADAVSTVSEYGRLDIGASYTTDDGKTRLYIRIAAEGRMTVPLYFNQTKNNGVTIDWGDGSTTQISSGTGNKKTSHTYKSIGNYCITFTVASDCILRLGGTYCVMGPDSIYRNMLRKVEMGKNVYLNGSTDFEYCKCLETIIFDKINIDPNLSTPSVNFYDGMRSISTLIIPKGVEFLSSYNAGCFPNLSKLILPKSTLRISCGSISSGFLSGTNIRFIMLIRNLYKGFFYDCKSLQTAILSNSLTGSIKEQSFFNCSSLSSIIIPSGITSIESNAFYGCINMAFYNFSNHTIIPTLSNVNAFYEIPSDCKIIVPDNLYDTWIAATNWSTYVNYIIKKSDWDSLQN